jgi:hypothetical protein
MYLTLWEYTSKTLKMANFMLFTFFTTIKIPFTLKSTNKKIGGILSISQQEIDGTLKLRPI